MTQKQRAGFNSVDLLEEQHTLTRSIDRRRVVGTVSTVCSVSALLRPSFHYFYSSVHAPRRSSRRRRQSGERSLTDQDDRRKHRSRRPPAIRLIYVAFETCWPRSLPSSIGDYRYTPARPTGSLNEGVRGALAPRAAAGRSAAARAADRSARRWARLIAI